MSRSRRLLPGFLFVVLAAPATAHDFWIEPSTYRPAVDERVTLRHRVGDHFRGDPLPRNPDLLVRFAAVDRDGERPVVGTAGMEPAGVLRIRVPGTTVVAYQSHGSVATLDAAGMARYVAEERLEPQLAAGWRDAPTVRDRFARSAKTLLVTPGASASGDEAAGFDRVVGLPLELVPLADPSRLPAGGGTLRLRLLHHGAPAPGIAVVALPASDPHAQLHATTDAHGEVALALPTGGVWLVKAVEIDPAEPASGADYDSLWASLTFLVGD